jgi:prepilin-type N-terminal cleavage/methylation domain-containing protein
MLKKIKGSKGFTLIELIIALAIFLIILGAMTPILIKSTSYLAQITAKVKYQNAASNIMNEIRTYAQNTNKANVFNGNETDLMGSMSGLGMFYTRDDYSAFMLKTESADIPIITSKDLDGKKIKVDFDVDEKTEDTVPKRRAMLHVVVSVYDYDQDMSYFTSHPNATVYKDTDGNVVDAAAPEPLYQHISGIYLINIATSINVPVSRGDMVKKAISDHLLSDPVEGVEEDGSPHKMTDAEIDKALLNDPNSNLNLDAASVSAALNNSAYERDYIGRYLRFAIVE